ncbi:MAG: hypothetical protein Q9179_006898 [Wetmoreana sp. 5 TL-2023]
MADAVWVCYIFQIVLVAKPQYDQLALAVIGMCQLNASSSWSLMLIVATWCLQQMILAMQAMKHFEAEDQAAVRQISKHIYGIPWMLPVHRLVPPAGLIAILLIIAGIEVNPGPVLFRIIFTLVMLVTTAGRKRPRSLFDDGVDHLAVSTKASSLHVFMTCRVAGAAQDLTADDLFVTMDDNPLCSKLYDIDMTMLGNAPMLATPGAVTNNVINFFLGLQQLNALPGEWLLMSSSFFQQVVCVDNGSYTPEAGHAYMAEVKERLAQTTAIPWYKHTRLLLPIKLQAQHHWGLVVVDLQKKELICYDPVSGDCVLGKNEKLQHLVSFFEEALASETETALANTSSFTSRYVMVKLSTPVLWLWIPQLCLICV